MDGVERERSLLVVEDDEATRSFLAENLEADGFRVTTAAGAAEGLRAVEARKPDLLLLDLMLEDGSGLALLDRVRAADGLASRIDPDLPIIVVTGRGGESERLRGLTRGADDYVVKPFSYAELLGLISSYGPQPLSSCFGFLERSSPPPHQPAERARRV